MASTSRVTIEEARVSGHYTELKSAGVTYTYAKGGRWIDGHEWASPRELEERTENGGRKDATKSWLVAQCLWWDLRQPGHRPSKLDTNPVLNELLYQHIMAGCVSCDKHTTCITKRTSLQFVSIHPKSVWDTLEREWKDKLGGKPAREPKSKEKSEGSQKPTAKRRRDETEPASKQDRKRRTRGRGTPHTDSDDEDSSRPRFEYIELPSGSGAFVLDLTKPQ
jgi:hypothetical protein